VRCWQGFAGLIFWQWFAGILAGARHQRVSVYRSLPPSLSLSISVPPHASRVFALAHSLLSLFHALALSHSLSLSRLLSIPPSLFLSLLSLTLSLSLSLSLSLTLSRTLCFFVSLSLPLPHNRSLRSPSPPPPPPSLPPFLSLYTYLPLSCSLEFMVQASGVTVSRLRVADPGCRI